MTIQRITLFKAPQESVDKFIGAYETLKKNAVKDSKPYILSLTASATSPDQRNQGYTLISRSEFKSLEDMKYYDEECAAHAQLKTEGRELGIPGPPLVVFYEV